MLGKLVGAIRTTIGVRQLNKLPGFQVGCAAIDKYWTSNHEAIKDFSKDIVQERALHMYNMVATIVASPDPRMANRQQFVDWVAEYARYQVLIIEPAPSPDATGLRGIYGITGELRSRLIEIAQKNKNIREFMRGFPPIETWGDVWNPILMRYRICYAASQVLHTVRVDLDDFNKPRDWFRPFFAAMCAFWQHTFDESLGIKSQLDPDPSAADIKSLALSGFYQAVMSGARYPDLQWVENNKDIKYERPLELAYNYNS
jgi:hypothetical protein